MGRAYDITRGEVDKMDEDTWNMVTAKMVEMCAKDDDRAAQGSACPNCFEGRVDWLVWNDDGETVTCASCGTIYHPEYEGGF